MTRIYEALQAAGREHLLMDRRNAIEPIRVVAPGELEECLLVLHRRIEALLEGPRSRIVAFVGIPAGEDSSRLVNLLARSVAYRLYKKVLLLIADPKTAKEVDVSMSRASELGDDGNGDVPWNGDKRTAREPGLVVRRVNAMELALPFLQGSAQLESAVVQWRERFDLVLLDAPPVSSSAGTEVLCSVADGVVFVVEAGKARWQAVKHGMEQITAQDGNVLGVILNKQRYYIPDFLYRML